MSEKIKIVFFGTPEFALKPLEALFNNFEIVAVVTNPDESVGRKQVLTPTPVKVLAKKFNIPVFQFKKLALNEWKSKIPKADLYVVVAYGKIIPKNIIEIPRFGSLNIHPSLLPCWRGPSPIQYAILNGDAQTGVTIMLMDEKMDHGPVLASRVSGISNFQNLPPRQIPGLRPLEAKQLASHPISKITTPELSEILSKMGAELIVETIPKWVSREIKPVLQDESKATYSKILKKEDGRINWSKSAAYIERQVRAFAPWPGSFTFWQRGEKEIKLELLETDVVKISDFPDNTLSGAVLVREKRLFIKTGQGDLEILRLQPEGKKDMVAKEFINGYGDINGAFLNS